MCVSHMQLNDYLRKYIWIHPQAASLNKESEQRGIIVAVTTSEIMLMRETTGTFGLHLGSIRRNERRSQLVI